MAAPGQQDVIGFTRIFVLFSTLVLLPALLLSSFGVIAIMNEREADKQRRRDEAMQVLQRAEERFAEVLDTSDGALQAALDGADGQGAGAADRTVQRLRAEGHPIGPWLLASLDGQVLEAATPLLVDDDVQKRLMRLAHDVEPGRPAHALVDDARFTAVMSVQRLKDGRVVLYAIDPVRLDAALSTPKGKGAMRPVLRVVDASDAPVVNAVDRIIAEVGRAREKAAAIDDGAPEELAMRRLEAPFDRFTLTVEAPPSRASTRTIIAYIVLMIVFLGTLITGVVITARLIWQETRLSRLKTDFVSHMSHELRTPLTSIRMFIETLRLGRAPSKEEQQECLDLLSKETERLSDMIERVLGYARLRAGRRLFNPRPVAAKDVIDDTLSAFRAQNLATDDLQLETEVEPGLPPMRADREALVEAMLNLVGNAYKYTAAHKEIRVFARHGRTGRVVLGVKDNGPGLPKTEHHRVFERFYQAGGLLSSKKPGSGLGLAITKAIIEGNGGKISVESEPGKGATFLIEMKVNP